jgi:glycosyltransferase involved in cell wall biosynthesis
MSAAERVPSALVLSTCAGFGGAERVVIDVADGLNAASIDAEALFPLNAPITQLQGLSSGSRVGSQPALKDIAQRRGFKSTVQLARFLRQRKPSVINIHYGVSHLSLHDAIAIRLARPQRAVASVHHPRVGRQSWRTKLMTRVASRLYDQVIVNSLATAEPLHESGVARSKITVVPCGVQTDIAPCSRAEARARLDIPPDAFVVLTVARLVPEKRIGLLVEAAKGLPGTTLLVAGQGPERSRLELAAAGLDCRFLGFQEDLTDVFAAADVFALPSVMEGFGLVFVEAALRGLPSVACRVGGVPEVVEDGKTGLLIAPDDLAGLRRALQTLRNDLPLRAAMGAAAETRARAEFSLTRMTGNYLAVLFPGSAAPNGSSVLGPLSSHPGSTPGS